MDSDDEADSASNGSDSDEESVENRMKIDISLWRTRGPRTWTRLVDWRRTGDEGERRLVEKAIVVNILQLNR